MMQPSLQHARPPVIDLQNVPVPFSARQRCAVHSLRRQLNWMLLALTALLTTPSIRAQQMPSMPGMTMPTPSAEPITTLPPLTPAANLLAEQPARPLRTLEDLIARAIAANPALVQSRFLTARADALARQTSRYPNPTIGYQGDQIRGGSFGGGEQGAFVAQTIPLGGKLALRRKALEAEAATTRTSTDLQQLRVRADVRQAFYAALAAQQTAHIRRGLFLVAQDAVQTAHQLANVGQADVPDLLAAEVEQEEAQLADEQAQRSLLALLHTLSILTGDPAVADTILAGDLAATPAPTSAQLFNDSPMIQEAQAEVAAAEARLASAHREVAPDLQLKAGEQYNFEQLGSSSGSQSTRTQVGPQTFASAAITIPLWNRNQGNIQAAEADLAGSRENLRRVRLSLRAQGEPILEMLATAQVQADRLHNSILPRAARALQLNEQKYSQMAQAYPQVLVARRTLLALQLRYTQALASIWQSTSALSSGNLFNSLDSVSAPRPLPPQMTPTPD